MLYERILVPVDGSPTSEAGLREAIRIARDQQAKLRLLHVVNEVMVFSTPDGGMNVGSVIEGLKENGKRILAHAERAVRATGVVPETTLVENVGARVADAILAEARRARANLIVMGTHGRQGFNRMLLGSDAELVVRNSTLPVLLIPGTARSPAKLAKPAKARVKT